jgi:quinol-cytochrome oxidoreductase complex cytochrome b subunit
MTAAVGGLPGGRDLMATARTIALGLLAIALATLAVTGVALYFVYRPTAATAFAVAVYGADAADRAGAPEAVRTIHRVTSALTIPTAVVAAALLVVGPTAPLRRGRGVAHAVAIPLVSVMASVTGFLLPWTMLGLHSVTVGQRYDGYGMLLDDDVRFAVVGSAEIAPATLTRWLVVHAVVLGPALVALTALAWRWTSRGRRRTIPCRGVA